MNRRTLAIIAVFAFVSLPWATAQRAPGSPASVVDRAEVSIGATYLRGNAPPGGCACFNTVGGYASGDYHLTNWISAAGEITGAHANNIGTLGQNLTLLTYTAGPRVSLPGRRFVPFAQGLFGVAHASDSYFPVGTTSSTPTATSFAILAGGGLDYNLTPSIGIRAFDVEYLRTAFPNGNTGVQNHLSVSAGVIFRFGNRNTGPRYLPSAPPPPRLQLVCSASVGNVDQGETLEITAATLTEPDGLPLNFSWSSSTGKISGGGPRILIDTTDVKPGFYSVHGKVIVEGTKTIKAECSVPFRVKTLKETIQTPPTPPAPPTDLAKDKEFHENVADALFDYNSASIRPDASAAIDRAKLYLDAHPDIKVMLAGYADDRGSLEFNLKLGEKRAQATRKAMIAAGIAPERLQIISYGKGVQLCTDTTETCRQQNRRVAFSMHP